MDRRHRYTERAMRVLTWAQEEAKSRGAQTMSSEHILLGLLREGQRCPVSARKLGIQPEQVKEEIDKSTETKPLCLPLMRYRSARRVLQRCRKKPAAWAIPI